LTCFLNGACETSKLDRITFSSLNKLYTHRFSGGCSGCGINRIKKESTKCKLSSCQGKETPEQKTEDLNFGASPLLQNHLPSITCMGGDEGKMKENELVNPVSVKRLSINEVV